jgi:hypothetical protein
MLPGIQQKQVGVYQQAYSVQGGEILTQLHPGWAILQKIEVLSRMQTDCGVGMHHSCTGALLPHLTVSMSSDHAV